MIYIVKQDRRFRISSAVLLTQVRLCFAGTGREILISNPLERLGYHPFILGLPAVRINGVTFPLVLSQRRVANHVLVFQAQSCVCLQGFFASYAVMALLCRFFVHFLGLFHVN